MKTNTGNDHASLTTALKSVMLLVVVLPLHSFALTWTGGGIMNSNWSDSANWGGTSIAPGDALVFNGSPGGFTTNDTPTRTSYPSILFSQGAAPFILNGNLLNLGQGITNDSMNLQKINLGISFSNNITLDGESNTLYIAAGLTNSVSQPVATTITLAGTGFLYNLFTGDFYPYETNIFSTAGNANWTLTGNIASFGPWAIQVNSGTFNFGTTSSAPQWNTTILSTPENQIGTVSGSTRMLNMVNGKVTISGLDMATTANAAAILKVTGGVLNITNVTGGSLYVAKSGNGSLIINNGLVQCGTIDLSGNAAGNSMSSTGAVYLNGGTLQVAMITNATVNAQAGGNPGSAFYFNGGMLMVKKGAPNIFLEGSRTTPVMPITAIVQAGGAIIDTAANNSLADPLVHDPALGSNLDGGLATVGSGTLTLLTANTYNGDTVIQKGTLALSGTASIAASRNIIIGGTNTFDVAGLSSTFILGASQTLSNGTARARILGNINATSGTVSLTWWAGLTPLSISNCVFTIGSGTILKINQTGAPFTAGIYTLIATNQVFVSGYGGAVVGTVPTTFTVTGGGIAPSLTASLLITNNQLDLVVAPPTPQITSAYINGTTLAMTATHGAIGGRYVLLESTNLSLPWSEWTPVLTNQFDDNGSLNLTTNIVNPNNPREFYMLSQ